MNEFEWIEQIRKFCASRDPRIVVGIGDDAAVVQATEGRMVVTTDALVEGVHFDFKYCAPDEVGSKALAVNLSDLAAMGAKPRHALVSLEVPKQHAKHLTAFYRGFTRLARKSGVSVIGGNLARSPKLFSAHVTLIGECRKGPLVRSGARAGDWVGVIGPLGEAAGGLALLRKKGRSACRKFASLCRAQLTPTPQTEAGMALAGVASSCIDVSDGLVSELHHLAQASKVGIVVDQERLVPTSALLKAAQALGRDPSEWILDGGEDYALLFTAKPAAFKRLKKWGARPLGVVVKSRPGVWMGRDGHTVPLRPGGFDHFRV